MRIFQVLIILGFYHHQDGSLFFAAASSFRLDLWLPLSPI